jgi:CheY-like chemotaxis protein
MMNKILLAEDDADQLNLITRKLKKYSDKFEVITANDGKEAIEVLKEEPVSLVITDIQMPRMNGMMVLAYVHTFLPNVPCFVMTAYGTSRLREKLPKDILRFFKKPFNVDDLAHAILAVLEPKENLEDIKGISLLSILDLIQMEKTTCVFEVDTPDGPGGLMYFEDGILFDAKCGDLAGESAALELISGEFENYRFKFSSEIEVTRRIKTDLQDLIHNVIGKTKEC